VELSVVTGDGRRLLASGGVPASVERRLLAEVRRGSSGEVSWSDSRGRFLGAYWTLPMEGNYGAGEWVVSLHLPAREAAAPVIAFRKLFPAVVLLALLASVLAASASIRRTLAPLDHLVAATRRLGEQSFAVTLPSSVSADLRELSAAFTAMGERLREQFGRLEAERARLSGLVEGAPYGVLLLGGDGRIVLANELARGYLTKLVADPAAPLHAVAGESLDELVARGGWHQVSVPAERAAAREFVLAASELPASGDGGSRLLVLRDVTEETMLQRQLEQGERLAAVGRLAAGMAHDLNNILQGIGMCAELLRAPLAGNAAALDDLVAMQRLQDRAATLIRQVLDFTRQSPRGAEHPLAVVPVVEETVHLLRRTLSANVQVELEVAPAAREAQVVIDPGRLQQVLTNLAVNARDAMPGGGVLALHVDLLASASEHRQQVRVRVRDNGSGIPLELQGKVFDPFFTTKPVGRGTGLGLAQVYGIITQHGGTVELTSTPGEGTEVRLLLPLAGSREEAASASPALQAP
jgi:signal transduction histidine kinase